jgi:hypothetical protein
MVEKMRLRDHRPGADSARGAKSPAAPGQNADNLTNSQWINELPQPIRFAARRFPLQH